MLTFCVQTTKARYENHKIAAANERGEFPSKVASKLQILLDDAEDVERDYGDIQIGNGRLGIFHVTRERKRLDRLQVPEICIVNATEKTCTCGKYQLDRFPCRHCALIVLKKKTSFTQFMWPQHLTSTWKSQYEPEEPFPNLILPVDTYERAVKDLEEGTAILMPPSINRRPGRPKKSETKRIQNSMSYRLDNGNNPIGNNAISDKRPYNRTRTGNRCGNCKEFGHNKKTCPAQPNFILIPTAVDASTSIPVQSISYLTSDEEANSPGQLADAVGINHLF